ncbi:phospholipase [Pseudomonas sp. 5P_3.1_Bac2]|uniref:phospholipase n=1 Tax=Pseudomonas sp. 5P_3.1_Bac2 TaxID=2971617 RepID=UPI0021C6C1A1|nr:phospholipase [Pseudomonas sp. 5P_3.1_Bac2]MCU1715774.1 phospholipase [Pseudomonas sp. 5P_3.1_Bac2]
MRVLIACALLQPISAWAWSNHALGSRLALSELPALQQPVRYEPFSAFVRAEAPALEQLLDEQERFAVAHFADYPARPEALRFSAQASTEQPLAEVFLQALRVNPQIRLAGFIQQLPGQADEGRAPLKPEQVLIFRKLGPWSHWRYLTLNPGDTVTALQVLSSAADEPDYGHDINLFSDNPGELGARYNFGPQPFGDARFEYSSQAPFHIGYYHEPALIYLAAPYLRQTLPHWRVYQYAGLARLAFASGHDYWGYRFLGWAMHYLQDLTQPYHSKTVPGYSTTELLWAAVKGALGDERERKALITRVADRHTAIEQYQLERMQHLLAQSTGAPPALLAAYGSATDSPAYPEFSADYPQHVVAAEANLSADEFDRLIGQWMAAKPAAAAGFSGGNQLHLAQADEALEHMLVQLFKRFGQHSRNLVKSTAPSGSASLVAEP